MSGLFHILLLSAGSLLGQNILDTLEGRRHKVIVIGLNSSGDNPRIYRCDKVYKSPGLDEPGFEAFLLDVIQRERPDMILAGRDHDARFLSGLAEAYPGLRACIPGGSVKAIQTMNDKALSCEFARQYGLPFAASFVLDNARKEQARAWVSATSYPVLAKPREGYGSLGIRILCDPAQLDAFLAGDVEGFLLQEMLDVSKEKMLQIQSFVRDSKAGVPFFFHIPEEDQYAGQTIIGRDGGVREIFTSKSLMILGRCEKTAKWEDPVFEKTVRRFACAASDIGWRGMFNLQCRKTKDGYAGIEMNGRMTGSTSARGYLGYDEMRKLILEFYDHDIGPDTRYPADTEGTVYRSLTDYYVSRKDQQAFNEKGVWTKGRGKKPGLLVTGATGYLGQRFLEAAQSAQRDGAQGDGSCAHRDCFYDISVVTGNKEKAKALFGDSLAGCYDREDLRRGVIPFGDIAVLFHLGFARPYLGNAEIAKSLEFTGELFSRAVAGGVPRIVNISSRSVYSTEAPLPWNEDSPVAPATVYGQGKYASELLLKALTDANPHTRGTSVRLGTVSGGSPGLVDVFFLTKFVRQALKGEPILITGGSQEFDILDIGDAAEAFVALLETPAEKCRAVYNLGSVLSYNIVDIAEKCVELASRVNGGLKSPILIEKQEIRMKYGMDSSLFRQDTNYTPRIPLESTIESLLEYYNAPFCET